MAPQTFKVAVLRLLWAADPHHAPLDPDPVWPDEMFNETFQANNGWSLRDYWHASSFGLLRPEFDFSLARWWRLPQRHGELTKREDILSAARRFVEEDKKTSLGGYDRDIAFIHGPSIDAGATTGGAVFDQGGSIPFYQHELGHVLGFMHSFGPFIPPPNEFGSLYNDPYCVMGYTGPQSHQISPPPELSAVEILDQNFWRSERRPAAASLYRRFTGSSDFVDSGWVAHVEPGQRVWIAALSEADNTTPVVAVMQAPGQPEVTVAIEYRTAFGDDAGVTPAVVVHSLGAGNVGMGRSEVNPPWFEGTIEPKVGEHLDLLGLHIEVMSLYEGSPHGVEVQITPTHAGAFDESKKTRSGAGLIDDPGNGESHVAPIGEIDDEGPHIGRRGGG